MTTYEDWVGAIPRDDKSTEMYRGQVFKASVQQMQAVQRGKPPKQGRSTA